MRRRQEKEGGREQRKKLPQSSDLLPGYREASLEPSRHLRWTRTSQNQNPAVDRGDYTGGSGERLSDGASGRGHTAKWHCIMDYRTYTYTHI